MKALARYAVIAGAVLPFLPSGHYGPLGAWNPQKLWLVVVLVTGFSFLGYVANRIFGERHGTIATALIGGAYSSTAVTQSLAQRLGTRSAGRRGACRDRACHGGHVPARALADRRPGDAGRWCRSRDHPCRRCWSRGRPACGSIGRRRSATRPRRRAIRSPLLPALGFVAFVAIAAVAAKWAAGRFGEQGIAVLLLIVGSTDVDTAIITLGGLHPSAISPLLAAIAIAGTIIANMTVKIGITLAYAGRKGMPAAIALVASVVALAAAIAVAWGRL